jgi:hypothetical protein
MLALKRSFLNREQTLLKVLEALVSIISTCSVHKILSKISPRYFT